MSIRDNIKERVALQKEVTAEVQRLQKKGLSPKQIREQVKTMMEARYGDSPNWDVIFKIVQAILTALLLFI